MDIDPAEQPAEMRAYREERVQSQVISDEPARLSAQSFSLIISRATASPRRYEISSYI